MMGAGFSLSRTPRGAGHFFVLILARGDMGKHRDGSAIALGLQSLQHRQQPRAVAAQAAGIDRIAQWAEFGDGGAERFVDRFGPGAVGIAGQGNAARAGEIGA